MISQFSQFRSFTHTDSQACLMLFDQNCPMYFAPNERAEFEDYLHFHGAEYLVYDYENQIAAAFGLHLNMGQHTARINWIMATQTLQKKGIGSRMMHEAITRIKDYGNIRTLLISASQHSSPFFAKFGAIIISTHENGWGLGMHRIEMELNIPVL